MKINTKPCPKCKRPIEKNQVFTIEPGIYFIPSLLQQLREKKAPVNWSAIEQLLSYGGIRIEDNVRVLEDGLEILQEMPLSQ